MLQKIIKNYKKKSWLRMCSLHGINKWELITHLNESVYPSKHLIKSGLELQTRNCLKCTKELELGIYKETFIANCTCIKDTTMTLDKLQKVLTLEQSLLAIEMVTTQRKKGLPNTIDFWIHKGFTVEESQSKVKDVQKDRSLKSPASKKGARGYSLRTVEYWINKGLTQEEAKLKIKHLQTTNGLSYYKNKYGDEKGETLFNDRIHRWLNAQGNKNMVANRSKKSLELFEKIGIGYYGPNEKTVRGKQRVHRVDFMSDKKVIEFYGDYWHGNPKIFSNDAMIRSKKITDVWEHDRKKIHDLEENGYSVLIIWEADYKANPEEILQQCREFINEC